MPSWHAVSYVLAAVIGYALLRRRIGSLELRRVFGTLGRLALAAALAGVPTVLVVIGLDALWGESKTSSHRTG